MGEAVLPLTGHTMLVLENARVVRGRGSTRCVCMRALVQGIGVSTRLSCVDVYTED